jgi:hypothetical protein
MRFDHHTLKPEYKHVGVWSWNNDILWSKIEVSLNPDECWLWHGAMSPTGAIFGVRKNGKPQMTQARRLVWMSENNEDVTPHRITMKCRCQSCLNPNHFELKPNLRLKENARKKSIWTMFGADNDN